MDLVRRRVPRFFGSVFVTDEIFETEVSRDDSPVCIKNDGDATLAEEPETSRSVGRCHQARHRPL
jgi:hypothetical protein